jgi:DNA polymerase III subunit epsilon
MPNPQRHAIALQAQKILSSPTKYVLWDTETTGLGSKDQVIQIAAIDCTGAVLIDQLVKPSVAINPQAQQVHGISASQLRDQPTWADVVEEWEKVIQGKRMGAYNIKFDVRILDQSYAAIGRQRPKMKGFCVMDMSTSYHGFKQKLGGDHSSIGDCVKTLDLIRTFARHLQEPDDRWNVPELDFLLEDLGLAPDLPFA